MRQPIIRYSFDTEPTISVRSGMPVSVAGWRSVWPSYSTFSSAASYSSHRLRVTHSSRMAIHSASDSTCPAGMFGLDSTIARVRLVTIARSMSRSSRQRRSTTFIGTNIGTPPANVTRWIIPAYVGSVRSTSSPGSITASSAEINPCVPPAVITICRSGSYERLHCFFSRWATACRRLDAPVKGV